MILLALHYLLSSVVHRIEKATSSVFSQAAVSHFYTTVVYYHYFWQAIRWCVPKSNNFSSLSASTQLSSSMNGTSVLVSKFNKDAPEGREMRRSALLSCFKFFSRLLTRDLSIVLPFQGTETLS